MSDAAAGEDGGKKAKQGAGKRLNDKQRVEIIQIAENSKISKRQLAERYGVSEAAIRKLLLKKDEFLKRYYDTPEEIRDQRLRGKNVRGHDLGVAVGADAPDGFNIGVSGFGVALGAGLAGLGTPGGGSANGDAAAGAAAAGVSVAALAAVNAYHAYYARSLYPQDEPWKNGLQSLTTKVTPFLKGFLQSKHVQHLQMQQHKASLDMDANALAGDGAAGAQAVDGAPGVSATPTIPVSIPLPEDAGAIDWIGFARMLRDIRRAFHRYPETGYQEFRTQAFLKRFCESSLRIPGKNIRTMASTGLVVDVCYENATISPSDKRKLPVLAFRADMDALPIEELNEHLPYCSTHNKQRKDARRRKKRKAGAAGPTKTGSTTTEGAGASSTVAETAEPTSGIGDSGMTTESEESGGDAGASASAVATAAATANVTDGDVDMALETSPATAPIAMTPPPSVSGLDDLEESESPAASGSTSSAAAHMCGHDGHMVMVLGLCALVVRNAHLLPKDTFVRFIFQPAEEGPGGAQKMIEEGALENVDEVYGLHNYPFPLYSVHVRPGPVMAHEVEFSIEIMGVGGHGSAPHKCVDPILTGAAVVQALQSVVSRSISPMDTAVLSVTQFRGGDANNVIPSRATLAGTIRVFNMEVAETIKRRVNEIVTSTCAAHGATGRVHFLDGYAPVINPYDETRAVQQVAMEAGMLVSEEGLPLMASEDFAYFLQERKGCYFFLGTKEEGDDDRGRALHSNHYDYNDKATPLGIRVFLGILQARFGCELYSADELQAFAVAMERIAVSISVV